MIDLEELRRERDPSDLLDWIDCLHATLATTEEDRKRLRLAKGPVKLLLAEARPLALFGRWLQRSHPDIRVRATADKVLPYDGILRSGSWQEDQLVEITQATDGYQEHLRMLHLNTFGITPASGPILYLRNRGDPHVVRTPSEMRRSSEVRSSAYQLLRSAAEKKLRKKYGRDTWLVLVFDDHVGFQGGHQDNKREVIAELQDFVFNEIMPLPWSISGIFVMGASGNIVVGGPRRESVAEPA